MKHASKALTGHVWSAFEIEQEHPFNASQIAKHPRLCKTARGKQLGHRLTLADPYFQSEISPRLEPAACLGGNRPVSVQPVSATARGTGAVARASVGSIQRGR